MSHHLSFSAALALILFGACTLFAQESDPFSYAARIQPSAEAWQMSRHGEISPDLYTGAMAWSLPLYTYKDEDFTIPISLDYRFDGCRPSQPAGTVGMGWNLNCGGVITRQVVGLPDEYYLDEIHTSYDLTNRIYHIYKLGFYYAANHNLVPQMALGDSLNANVFMTTLRCTGQMCSLLIDIGNNFLTASMGTTPLVYHGILEDWVWAVNDGSYFDPNSDIYHFSLPDVSGDFIIMPDGNVKVFNCTDPEGEVAVEIDYDFDIDECKIIVIRKGYRYVFGGDLYHLDYAVEIPTSFHGLQQTNPKKDPTRYCFTALHLNTITAPNGRTAFFDRSLENICSSTKWKSAVNYRVNGYNQTQQPYPSVVHTFGRTLNALQVDGRTIASFNYSNKAVAEFGKNSFVYLPNWQYENIGPSGQGVEPDSLLWFNEANRLSSIIVQNEMGEQVDRFYLSHHYTGTSNHNSSKMFLDCVTGNFGKFSFTYGFASGSDFYPPIDAIYTDHWGYWNDNASSYTDITTNRQRVSLYDLPSNAREPDSTYTMHGALRRIEYPSGGWSLIDYECNRVNLRIDINLDSETIEEYGLSDCPNMLVGGARVKSITSTGRYGVYAETTTYDYGNSGTLMKMPRYYLDVYSNYQYERWEPYSGPYHADDWGMGQFFLSTFCDRGLDVYETGGHVGYDTVYVRNADSSFVKHTFHGYQDYPDGFLVADNTLIDQNSGTCSKVVTGPFENHPNSIGYYLISGLSADTVCRNTLLANIRLSDFSSLRGKPVSEMVFSADSVLLERRDYSWRADTASQITSIFNAYCDFVSGNRTFVQPRLDSVITTEYLPDGGVLSDTTSYTYNSLGQQRIVERRGFDGSVRRSRFSYEHESDATAPPANVAAVATSRLYVDGNNRLEYLTSLRHIEYETDSALRHLPILSQEFCSKAPRSPVVNDGGIEWFAPKSTDDTLARRLSYNALQRPALLSLPGGAYVAFTWDASGRYPLSREDNGPAMKSYYTWKDMVGLTQLTDPTGRSEWYSYDEKNRLSEIFRADSVLVKEYDYHIYSEDTTLGPSSIKQTIWRTADKNNRDIVYYDGLGYPIQKVRTSTLTTDEHIVTPIAYDALRRDDAKVYLPYGANCATYDSAAFRKQQHHYCGYGKDSLYAYTEKEYGTSPAGRLLSVRKPGKVYADSAKRIVYEYRTNTLADSILNLYATVDTLSKLKVGSGYLPDGKLLLTKTTDEDGCTSEVFTNSTGRTVLARQRTGGARLDTYYVYDLRDSLVCVLQPEGAARITLGSVHDILRPTGINSADTIPQIGSLLSEYAFLYAYDSHGRLVAKKLPGAAAEEFIPDDRGRTILSRNGNLRTAGKWLYNEYDCYDALLRSSLISANVGLDTLRKAARGQVDIIYPDTTWMWPYYYPQDQEIVLYGRTAILAAGDSLFTPELDYTGNVESAGNDPILGHYIVFEMERYYVGASAVGLPDGETTVVNWPGFFAAAITDSTLLEEHRYDRGDTSAVPAALAFSPVTGIVSQGDLGSTRNLELWQRQLLLPPGRTAPDDTLHYVERAFWYDTLGTLVQTVERNALGGVSRTSAKYDYLGNVIVSEEKHAVSGNNTPTVKRSSLTYDSLGRIASEDVTVNGTATGTLFFYDLMGRQTYAGWSAASAEMVEIMSYDICGRLTDKETYRMWNEAGGEEAERGRWSITGVATTLDTAQAVIPLGNRNGDDGEEQEPEEPDLPADQPVFKQHLKYFDPTEQSSQPRWNGLISEIAHQRTDTGTVITNGYFYDHAGRLTDHIRYEGSSQTNKYTERDLSFDRNGNILSLKRYGTNVAAPQENLAYTYDGNKLMQLNGSTYQYDANGNMTHDGRRGLDLSWNHLNLPSSICSDENEDALVNYTYLADGTKVITQQPAAGEGYAYLGSAIYKLVNNVWTLESVPFTGGRFIANATGGMDEYRYITDHLGSTRVIVTGTDYHEVEHDDYYPFGKRIADNSLPTTQNNRWRFSGKEIQTLGGIGLVDFGARLYDDFLGRWITNDPLGHTLPISSGYNYCRNSPLSRYDPDGMTDYFDIDGNLIFRDNVDNGLIKITTVEEVNKFKSELKEGSLNSEAWESFMNSSRDFSEAAKLGDMTQEAIMAVYKHYDLTGLPFEIDNGMKYNFSFNTTEPDNPRILVNVNKNASNKGLNSNSYDIVSSMVHEWKHYSDYKSGLSLPKAELERRAINEQINHPSWKKVTKGYKESILDYLSSFTKR